MKENNIMRAIAVIIAAIRCAFSTRLRPSLAGLIPGVFVLETCCQVG